MALSADPELVAAMGWQPFGSGEEKRFREFTRVVTLPRLSGKRAVVFSIMSAVGDSPIGYVAVKGMSEGCDEAELGMAIMDKAYRGQGCGTAALRLAAAYAFNNLGIKRLGLTVFPINIRAIKAYQRVGFKKVKLLQKSWLLSDGRYADMWLMQLAIADFVAVSQGDDYA